MATGTTESPATLYGPVSIAMGVIALITMYFLGPLAFLAGSLAVTFGILGLVRNVNRTQCLIGLVIGAFGVFYPLTLLFLFVG